MNSSWIVSFVVTCLFAVSFSDDVCPRTKKLENPYLISDCVKRAGHDYEWAVCLPGISVKNSWHFCDLKHSNERCGCDSKGNSTQRKLFIDKKCFKIDVEDCSWYTDCFQKSFPSFVSSPEFIFASSLCETMLSERNDELRVFRSKDKEGIQTCIWKNSFTLLVNPQADAAELLGKIVGQCLSSNYYAIRDMDGRQFLYWAIHSILEKTNYPKHIKEAADKVFEYRQKNIIPNVVFIVSIKFLTSAYRYYSDTENILKSTTDSIAKAFNWRENNIRFECSFDYRLKEKRQKRNAFLAHIQQLECIIGQGNTNAGRLTEYFFNKHVIQSMEQVIELNTEVSIPKNGKLLHAYINGSGSTWCCYRGLRCIETDMPMSNIIRNDNKVYPHSPEDVQVSFTMYSQGTPHPQSYPIDIYKTDGGIKKCTIDNQKTYFVIHGFKSSGKIDFNDADDDDNWVRNITEEVLSKDARSMVVAVDWERGADHLFNYYQAAINTLTVGTLTARVVSLLENSGCSTLQNIHMIGHSLGAQTSGIVGSSHRGHIGRITGLDPAGPFFERKATNCRLDKSDAKFVDIIHTNGRIDESTKLGGNFAIVTGDWQLGMFFPIGHVDFYPNGGVKQPDCSESCSHSRSHSYFIESIRHPQCFVAKECLTAEDCLHGTNLQTKTSIMGFGTDPDSRGRFHLNTTGKSPFCEALNG